MGKLVLYKLDGSPPANAVRTLCEILGVELELKNVDFANLEHKSPQFLKINPMGTVPTIEDGDFILSESNAIMIYLLSKYGSKEQQESLYPSDIYTRAIVNQIMHFNTGVFFVRLKVIALPAIFETSTGPTQKNKDDVELAYGVVEAYLKDRNYIAADHVTLADFAAGATAAAMGPLHKLNTDKFPRTAAWLSRLNDEVPGFKKCVGHGAEVLDQFINACWERNKKK